MLFRSFSALCFLPPFCPLCSVLLFLGLSASLPPPPLNYSPFILFWHMHTSPSFPSSISPFFFCFFSSVCCLLSPIYLSALHLISPLPPPLSLFISVSSERGNWSVRYTRNGFMSASEVLNPSAAVDWSLFTNLKGTAVTVQ